MHDQEHAATAGRGTSLLSQSAAQKAQSPGATGPHAAQTKPTNGAIIRFSGLSGNPTGHEFEPGEFRHLRARFAKRGYSLQRVYRAGDGRASFHIMRSSKTNVLSHPHDVRAFLAQVEGAPV